MRPPTHDLRQNIAAKQRLGNFKELVLFETHVCGHQLREPQHYIRIWDFKLAHQTLQSAMFDQGTRYNSMRAGSFQAREQALFFLAEMRQQFAMEHFACLAAGSSKLRLVATGRSPFDMECKPKRGVVFARKILEFRATFHGSQCSPAGNISP